METVGTAILFLLVGILITLALAQVRITQCSSTVYIDGTARLASCMNIGKCQLPLQIARLQLSQGKFKHSGRVNKKIFSSGLIH